MKALNLVGQKFGRLRAIKPTSIRTSGFVLWSCECDCGNETIVSSRNLQAGHTKSCGCLKEDHKNKLKSGEAAFNSLFYHYKRNARIRNLEFNLTKEEFKNLVSRNCIYCGAEPHRKHRYDSKWCNGSYLYNGIDRVDNSGGYNLDNVATCCFDCNRSKDARNREEFLNWIERVYNTSIRKV